MNLLLKINISDQSRDEMVNGGFESWASGAPANWTETEAGTSTINQDTTVLAPDTVGSSSARFDISAANDNAALTSDVFNLIPGVNYKISFWYKMSASSKTATVRLRDSAANVFLDENGEWTGVSTSIELENSRFWRKYELEFTANASYTQYDFQFRRDSAASSSIYFDDLQIALMDTFCALTPGNYNFNGQAQNWDKSIDDVSDLVLSIGKNNSFEASNIVVSVDDTSGYFKNIEADGDISLIGRRAILYQENGTIEGTFSIYDYRPVENSLYYFELSNMMYEFGKVTLPGTNITVDNFPNAPAESLGKPVPHFSNQFQAPPSASYRGENMLKAWRVDTNKYLLGKSIQNVTSLQYAHDPDSNDITSSRTATLVTPTGSDPYHYITITAGTDFEYLSINFVYPDTTAVEMIEEIGDLLFQEWPFNTDNIQTILGVNRRHYTPEGGLLGTYRDCHFALQETKSAEQVIKDICYSFNLNWFFNSAGEIEFNYLDYLDTTADKTYQTGEISTIKADRLPDHMINKITVNTAYDHPSGSYKYLSETKKQRSQDFNSIVSEVDRKYQHFPFVLAGADGASTLFLSHITDKLELIERDNPQQKWTITPTSIDKVLSLELTNIVSFSHPVTNNVTKKLLVTNIVKNYKDNTGSVSGWDITHIDNLDIDCKLLIQSDTVDEAGSFFDNAVDGFNIVWQAAANTKHDTDIPLFGKSTMKFNGTDAALFVGNSARYNDFLLCADPSAIGITYISLDFWVYFDATGSIETICGQYEDINNRWRINKRADDKLEFLVIDGSSTILTLVSANAVTAGEWHHVVLFRSASVVSLYVDGAQEAYSSTVLDSAFPVKLSIGQNGNDANWLDGNIQSLRFRFFDGGKNWFGLSPDAGLTDTYNPPWGLYSDYYQEYYGG